MSDIIDRCECGFPLGESIATCPGCQRVIDPDAVPDDDSHMSEYDWYERAKQRIKNEQQGDSASEWQEPSGDEKAGRLLSDTADVVSSERDTHGDAVENQSHIGEFWTVYLRGQGLIADDEEVTGGDVGRMMALLKLSRTAVGDYDVDHDRDMAGYAAISAACEVDRGNADASELTVDDLGDHE